MLKGGAYGAKGGSVAYNEWWGTPVGYIEYSSDDTFVWVHQSTTQVALLSGYPDFSPIKPDKPK